MLEYQLFLWILQLSIDIVSGVPEDPTSDALNMTSNSTNSTMDEQMDKYDDEGRYLVRIITIVNITSVALGVVLGSFTICFVTIIREYRNSKKQGSTEDTDMESHEASAETLTTPTTPIAPLTSSILTTPTISGTKSTSENTGKPVSVESQKPKPRANLMGVADVKEANGKPSAKKKKDEFTKKQIKFIETKKKKTSEYESDKNFPDKGPIFLQTLAVGHTELLDHPNDETEDRKIEKVQFDEASFCAYSVGVGADVDEPHKSQFASLNGSTSVLTASIRTKSTKIF